MVLKIAASSSLEMPFVNKNKYSERPCALIFRVFPRSSLKVSSLDLSPYYGGLFLAFFQVAA
jgi:hypothetical protein